MSTRIKYPGSNADEKAIQEPIPYHPPVEDSVVDDNTTVDALQRRIVKLETLLLEKDREIDRYQATDTETASPPSGLIVPGTDREGQGGLYHPPSSHVQQVEHRGHPRFIVDWRATLLEETSGKASISDRAYDISLGETSFSFLCQEHAILPPNVLLLLDVPLLTPSTQKHHIKVRARIAYVVLASTHFRIGLQFGEFLEGGRKMLKQHLSRRVNYF